MELGREPRGSVDTDKQRGRHLPTWQPFLPQPLSRALALDGPFPPVPQGTCGNSSQAGGIGSTEPFATSLPLATPGPLVPESIWLGTQALGEQVSHQSPTSARSQEVPSSGQTWLLWAGRGLQLCPFSLQMPLLGQALSLLLSRILFLSKLFAVCPLCGGQILHQLEGGPEPRGQAFRLGGAWVWSSLPVPSSPAPRAATATPTPAEPSTNPTRPCCLIAQLWDPTPTPQHLLCLLQGLQGRQEARLWAAAPLLSLSLGRCRWTESCSFPPYHQAIPQGKGRTRPLYPILVALTLHSWPFQMSPVWGRSRRGRGRALLHRCGPWATACVTWDPVRSESQLPDPLDQNLHLQDWQMTQMHLKVPEALI